MTLASNEWNDSVVNSEQSHKTVAFSVDDVSVGGDWMTEETCRVFAALRRKYGTIQERRVLNRKYKDIICKQCKVAGITCDASTSIKCRACMPNRRCSRVAVVTRLRITDAMKVDEQQYEQLLRWYRKARKQHCLKPSIEVDVGFMSVQSCDTKSESDLSDEKLEHVHDEDASGADVISPTNVTEPSKYFVGTKTQDDKYEETFPDTETVDIPRYKVDELTVTPSRSNVTIKSANYVVGEDVALASMYDVNSTPFKDKFHSSDSLHDYNSSQLSVGDCNLVDMQYTKAWNEQDTVKSNVPVHCGSRYESIGLFEEPNSLNIIYGDTSTAEYVYNVIRAFNSFSYVNSSSLFNALGDIDTNAVHD
ncbi:hypothetical protein F5051DRAFT_445148 [Lentinula edodes]|nr:hypothetical protein F5051DRAFT_445148 [Lentinula edodes]